MQCKSGMIYWYRCDRVDCDEEYTGESVKTFGKRYHEDLKAPSPIYDLYITTGHITTMENFSKVGRKGHGFTRMIESIYIRVNNLALNRNIGKYNLPHIWDGVLINTPELQIKLQQEDPQHSQAHKTSLVLFRISRSYLNVNIKNIPQT